MAVHTLAPASLALLVFALGSAIFASGELAGGVVEIPDHWWSTIIVGVPLFAAATTGALWWRKR